MTIYIIGSGPAGIAASLSLRMQYPSTRIILFERSPQKSGVTATTADDSQGHGMILLPNALKALDILGAKENIMRSCRSIKTIRVTNGNNHSVESFADEMYCCTREALVSGLSKAMIDLPSNKSNNVEIMFDKRCVHVQMSDERCVVQLSFADETRFDITRDDLVVGADGVGSLLYKVMNPNVIHRPCSQVFEVVTSTVTPSLANKLGSAFQKVVLPEYGLAMGLVSPSDDSVIGFIQFDSDRYQVPSNSSECRNFFHLCTTLMVRADEKSLFAQYCEDMNEKTAHIWRPVNADLPDTMHLVNAVIIGDAAHPVLPFTSQGVAAALEDAIILANCLCDGHSNGFQTTDAALSQFVSLRRDELQKIIILGRNMLDKFVNGDNEAMDLPYVIVEDKLQFNQTLGMTAC